MNEMALTDTDIARLSDEDVARLYQRLSERLRAAKRLDAPNANVVAVRVAPEIVDRIKQIAVRLRRTRSQVLREALSDFAQRHSQ